jgi:hypothetical protein
MAHGHFTNTADLRDQMDADELEALVKMERGEETPEVEPNDVVVVEPQAPAVAAQSEETWKKRYGDLRRKSDNDAKEFRRRISELEQRVEKASRQQVPLPKSDEELEAWASEYPDLYGVFRTVVAKETEDLRTENERLMKLVAEGEQATEAEKAKSELLKRHPDLEELQLDENFHTWLETKAPKWAQDALYRNHNDWENAADAIDLYKLKYMPKPAVEAPKAPDLKAAAKTVRPSNRAEPELVNEDGYIKESDLHAMSPREFEKNMDAISKAQREGKIIYDMSSKAPGRASW